MKPEEKVPPSLPTIGSGAFVNRSDRRFSPEFGTPDAGKGDIVDPWPVPSYGVEQVPFKNPKAGK